MHFFSGGGGGETGEFDYHSSWSLNEGTVLMTSFDFSLNSHIGKLYEPSDLTFYCIFFAMLWKIKERTWFFIQILSHPIFPIQDDDDDFFFRFAGQSWSDKKWGSIAFVMIIIPLTRKFNHHILRKCSDDANDSDQTMYMTDFKKKTWCTEFNERFFMIIWSSKIQQLIHINHCGFLFICDMTKETKSKWFFEIQTYFRSSRRLSWQVRWKKKNDAMFQWSKRALRRHVYVNIIWWTTCDVHILKKRDCRCGSWWSDFLDMRYENRKSH